MIKRIILFFTLIPLLFSCTGIKTSSVGLENQAFLEFIGTPSNYHGESSKISDNGVDVNINNKIKFKAQITRANYSVATGDRVRSTTAGPKGKVYAIPTGTHDLTVSHHGKILYRKKIFVGAQETKRIKLP
ncbi:MAG: hypothetical protein VX347_01730 [Bacteroidota bacterium]|nr:hypothetical protein [Bacteroidota bacterium]